MVQATMKYVLWGLLLLLTACQATPQPASPAPHGWTVGVPATGVYWLPASWWHAQGVTSGTDTPTLQPGGLAKWIDAPQGRGALLFAPAPSGYTLMVAPQASPTPVLTDGASSSPQTSTLATARLERDLVYRSTAPVSPPWLWASLIAPASLTVTIPLTEALPAPLTITVHLWGQSQMPQSPDHHIELRWNGASISDHSWDGNQPESWQVVVPSASAGVNRLTLVAPGDTGAPVDVTWLDRIDITWTQALRYHQGWGTWRVNGSPQVCWEQVPPQARVVWAEGDLVYDGGSVAAGRACFAQPEHGRGWIGVPWEAPAPTFIRPREVLTDSVADFVIVAPREFQAALTPLVSARAAEGLTVRVITPESVYDTFGDGLPDGAAIRRMVRAWRGAGLRYLLLVGDASADSRAMRYPAPVVPTAWVRTSIVGWTASDERLAEDEDDVPQVAVGRFPADAVADVKAMVAKTLAWKPTSRLLLLTDDESDFASLADSLAPILAPQARLDAGDAEARYKVLAWLKASPGLLIYAGHGSLPLLADEKLLTGQDAGAWNGPTVVALWTCLSATFTHPAQDGLGELWLRAPRGVVALVGPTGETSTSEQRAMALAFQQSLAGGERLGEAVLAGWQAATSDDARRSFLLLGDPTLPLSADE